MTEQVIRVLLVDDEELIRSAMVAWLEDDRFQVTEADSGTSALRLLAEKHFDVGLLDLNLKDMTGMEVLKTARYAGEKPCWLVMTGNLDEETYHDLHALGISDDAILAKPIFAMQALTIKILACVKR